LQLPRESKPIEATFVGKLAANGFEPKLYFYEKSKNIVHSLSPEEVQLNNKLDVDELPAITAQTDATCAAHATMNCILFLQKTGTANSHTFEVLTSNLNEVLSLMKSKLYQEFDFGSQKSHQEALFRKYGFSVKSSTSVQELKNHLRHGDPAIVSSWVHPTTRPVRRSGGEIENAKAVKPGLHPDSPRTSLRDGFPKPGPLGAGHDVVAIAYLDGGWFANGKIVILDSAYGQLDVWDLAEFKNDEANPAFELVSRPK
jgi:hypothetical protein